MGVAAGLNIVCPWMSSITLPCNEHSYVTSAKELNNVEILSLELLSYYVYIQL